MHLQILTDSLRINRKARVSKTTISVQLDEASKIREIYRNQWSSLLRLVWTDTQVISLFAMTPSNTSIIDEPAGFQFICHTLAKIIFEKIFYNVDKLKITDDVINGPLPYIELHLVGVEGMVLLNLLFCNINFILLLQIYLNY